MPEAVSKPLQTSEQQAILSVCGDDFFGLRSRVVLELSMRLGLLEREIHELNLGDVTAAKKPAKQISIPSKNGEAPSVETDDQFRNLLGRYLKERADFVEGNPEMIDPGAPLILSQALTRLTQRALRKSLKGVADDASVDRLTFHTLRATFIRGLWEQTKDVKEVARRGRLRSAATVIRHIGMDQI